MNCLRGVNMIKIMFFTATFIYISMSAHILIKDSSLLANRLYFILSLLYAYWSLVTGILFLVDDPAIIQSMKASTVIAWGVIYSIVLHLLLLMSGNERYLKKKLSYIIIYVPALINLYLYLSDPVTSAELIKTTSGFILENKLPRNFFWNNYFNFYYSTFLIFGLLIVFNWYHKTTHKREKKQAQIILYTVLLAFIVGSIIEVILPLLGYPSISGITSLIALIPISGIFYAIEKYNLMSFKPENLIGHVLPIIEEGIIINDETGKIYSINNSGLNMLGYSSEDCPSNIKQIFSSYNDSDSILTKCTKLKSKSKNIDVLLSTSNLIDTTGEKYGEISVFSDITILKNYQLELQTLNNSLQNQIEEKTKKLVLSNNILKEKILETELSKKKIYELAFYDYLTGLPNKRYMHDLLKKEISLCKSNHSVFALLFLDLDLFKRINDTMGHEKGDELLIKASQGISMNINSNDLISRNGGDEFIIILKDVTDNETLIERILSIMNIFSTPFEIDSHLVYITCSIGVSVYGKHSIDPVELIQYADLSMYNAKEAGRNKYRIFNKETKENIEQDSDISNMLYKAIYENQLEIHYQPQNDPLTNKVTGVEALARWKTDEGKYIPPSKFIPIAEKTGLILNLGNWIIEESMKQKKKWKESGILNVPLAINISANQFTDRKILDFVKDKSVEYGMEAGDLEFEVTENVIMDKYKYSVDILCEFSSMGIGIVIDDFGIEYSCMKYLKSLPIDKIKIDREFVMGIGEGNGDEAIIKAILSLASNFKFEVVAEGVETETQVTFLLENNCNIMQGYLYFMPTPAKELESLILSKSTNINSIA